MRRSTIVFLAAQMFSCDIGWAQSSSLYQREVTQAAAVQAANVARGGYAPRWINNNPYEQSSWTYLPIPPVREVRINDIISIRVDELSRVTSEGEMERRKNSQYDAILREWIELIGLKALKPAPQADGDPRVSGQVQQQYRAEGQLETRDSLIFNIAAKVVDLRPNGNVVLEAHRQLRINNEVWEYSLSGECRREDVNPDNTLLSRNIVDLRIDKRERGHVRDAYRRGWLQRWFDQVHPF